MIQSDYSYLAVPKDIPRIVHQDHYIKHGEREKHIRKIFEEVQYDDYENQFILEFEAEVQKRNIKLPEGWRKSDSLKIVYNSKFKLKEAFQRLEDNLKWRANPVQIDQRIQDFLTAGILYTFGRDKQYRPIVYLNTFMIDEKKHDKFFMIHVLSYFLSFVKKHMLLDGQVENWIFVVETKEQGVFSIPRTGLGDVIKAMALNFAGNLHKMVVLNPSTGLNLMWSAASAMMDDDAKSKNQFITKKNIDKLQELVPRDQLEKKYNGTQDNCSVFWPPQLPK